MRKVVLIFFVVSIITSCGIVRQSKEFKTLSRCEFRIYSIDDISLAGIRINDQKSMNDFDFGDFAKLTTSMASGELPLKFDVNIQIRNPNDAKAALNELEWILLIDEEEITRGDLKKRVEINPQSTKTVPVKIDLNILDVLTGGSANALINFAMNLNGQSDKASKVTLKVKPTIYIAGKAVAYTGWIEIDTGFSAD